MPPSLFHAVLSTTRTPMVWLVALALIVYGHSATMAQLVGPMHRHQPASSAPAAGLWERIDDAFGAIRAWRAELRERLLPGEARHLHADGSAHAAGAHVHAQAHARGTGTAEHTHSGFERHRHDARDGSVVTLDSPSGAMADAATQAGAGSASLPLALAPRWSLPEMAGAAIGWPGQRSVIWTDALLPLSKRPPRS